MWGLGSKIGFNLGHVGHAAVGLWQAVEEAAGGVQQLGGGLHVVPREVFQQRLQGREDAAEGRQPELGQLACGA